LVSINTRRIIESRAGGRCEYCASPADHTPDDFAAEHIFPVILGGTSDLDNLAWSCQGCNSRKFTATQAVDPQTRESALLYHPRRDQWSDHFQWSADPRLLIGLTPTGRATIARMDLNRYNVVNLREVLALAGKHPPIG